MKPIHAEIGGRRYRADFARPVSLAIPLAFDGAQPRFFAAPVAHARPLRAADFSGDTRAGASCNVSSLELTPHCNGTHTECIGHVVNDEVAVAEQLAGTPLPATLLSVTPREGAIDAADIEPALAAWPLRALHQALILRTLPNPESKRYRDYAAAAPGYLKPDAVKLALDTGVQHLLVDLPSLDPVHDEGRLAAHRMFWGLPADSRRLAHATRPSATITEMIYVPESVADGYYLLDLQIPAFVSDAAPSRPIIYPLEPA